MFILTTFTLIFKEKMTFITLELSNLELGFRVDGWGRIF